MEETQVEQQHTRRPVLRPPGRLSLKSRRLAILTSGLRMREEKNSGGRTPKGADDDGEDRVSPRPRTRTSHVEEVGSWVRSGMMQLSRQAGQSLLPLWTNLLVSASLLPPSDSLRSHQQCTLASLLSSDHADTQQARMRETWNCPPDQHSPSGMFLVAASNIVAVTSR